MNNIVIENRAAKRARISASVEVGPPPSINKGKRAMENLSSAPDNDLLNSTEVGIDSTSGSTGMLCNKVFGGVSDVSDPWFLAVVCNLACATK